MVAGDVVVSCGSAVTRPPRGAVLTITSPGAGSSAPRADRTPPPCGPGVGAPPRTAEGVGPDDHESRGRLISALRRSDARSVRPGDEVPAAYDGFPLVEQRKKIVAPYSRNALAVELPEEDVLGWVAYALARNSVR